MDGPLSEFHLKCSEKNLNFEYFKNKNIKLALTSGTNTYFLTSLLIKLKKKSI